MDSTATERVVGRLESDVNTLKEDVKDLRAESKEQTTMLRTLTAHMERQKGSWKILTVEGSILAVLLTLLVEWFKK
jgi:uncharacterized protein (UPF0335 family)